MIREAPDPLEHSHLASPIWEICVHVAEVVLQTLAWVVVQGNERTVQPTLGPPEVPDIPAHLDVAAWVLVLVAKSSIDLGCR